ncbi:MAG: FliH/SctL family protein [Gudongella sp.]|nr:FliH/SctL family protein [Gudongella sp.]
MTLSYRIIKSENLNLSKDGVEIAGNLAYKPSKKSSAAQNNYGAVPSVITEEEKMVILQKYEEELRAEKETQLKEIVQKARAEAEEIKERARVEGHSKGFEEGYSEGEREVFEKLSDLHKRATDTILEAQKQVEEYVSNQRENIIRLAGQMAEKIVNQRIDSEGDALLTMINQVLQEYKKGGVLIIYCNRKHMRKLKENVFELKKHNGEIEYIIMEDPMLEENRITLEYDNRIIDMDIAEQIQSMVNELIGLEV